MSTAETPQEAALPVAALPPPVTDFGPVRFEAMGHRYREGRLSEVMMAGQGRSSAWTWTAAASSSSAPSSVYCASARPRPRCRGRRSRRGSTSSWTTPTMTMRGTWTMTTEHPAAAPLEQQLTGSREQVPGGSSLHRPGVPWRALGAVPCPAAGHCRRLRARQRAAERRPARPPPPDGRQVGGCARCRQGGPGVRRAASRCAG